MDLIFFSLPFELCPLLLEGSLDADEDEGRGAEADGGHLPPGGRGGGVFAVLVHGAEEGQQQEQEEEVAASRRGEGARITRGRGEEGRHTLGEEGRSENFRASLSFLLSLSLSFSSPFVINQQKSTTKDILSLLLVHDPLAPPP